MQMAPAGAARTADKSPGPTNLRRIWKFLIPYRKLVAVSIAFNVAYGAMAVAVPQMSRILIDRILPAGDARLIGYGAAVAVAFFALKALLYYGNMYTVFIVVQSVILDVRMMLYRHILRLPVPYFETRMSGAILSRLIGDVNSLETLILTISSRLVGETLQVLAVATVATVMSPLLGLSMTALVLASFVVFYRNSMRIREISRRIQAALSRVSGAASEVLTSIRAVKAFTNEPYEATKLQQRNEEYRSLNLYRRQSVGAMECAVDFISNLALIAVLAGGGYLVMGGRVTLGVLTASLLYLRMMIAPMRSIVMFGSILQTGLASLDRVFEVIDTPAETSGPELADGRTRGNVSFEDVTFAYQSSTQPVLAGVSFEAAQGQRIALVGPSGAGKTTVTYLLARFHDPQAGRIRLDGIDTKQLNLAFLRQQIGMVLQDPELFSGSVLDNIRYGRLDATDEEVAHAAQMANAEEFIVRLPKGYSTEIGERGVKLSGGQKQRIAIARAVLKNPVIIVMDEATAFQDSESEHLINEALERLLAGRTTFVIAHRLSTVVGADQIIVLDRGRLVESGTHGDLLARDGLYARLFEVQFKRSNSAGQDQPPEADAPDQT